MRRFLAAWMVFTAALFVGYSLTQVDGVAQSRLPLLGAGKVSATPAAFSGPGDVVTSAAAHWGAEAYTSAYASGGGLAFNVCLAADVSCGDLVFNSTGAVVDALVGASLCSAVPCTIKTAYDHTGNGNDVTNATEATRPTIQFNCQGGRACMVFPSGALLSKTNWNGGVSISQPWTYSVVYNDTGSSTVTAGLLIQTVVGTAASLYSNDGASNQFECFFGATLTATATNNSWHSTSAVGNGASSALNVDGSATNGNCGTRQAGKDSVKIGTDGSSPFVGKMFRIGIWPSAFSSGNSSTISTNDHAFGGF